VLDWLAREGGIFLSWWALVTLAGAAALPLCARLLGRLPDKGYTLARAAGLLVVGFAYWLLASFGFLRNTAGNMALAWLLVLCIGLLVYARLGSPFDWRDWWRENRPLVIAGEVLFFALLLGWTIYRAHQNNLTGTEKPMELMFMNSVARSDVFPPNDGWMAGYAISYYYFGYVMVAMLSTLSGVPATTGFNMTNALLFALTGLSAFGVVYNLVRSRAFANGVLSSIVPGRGTAIVVGILGMVFVVLMGNFQLPFVEMPYQTNSASEDYLRFWNVDERQTPIVGGMNTSYDPANWGHWWWFRAARVLNDLDLSNNHIEVIDEFPQFSFLLADNHPHVLALPFVMLALGMALNILLTPRRPNLAELLFYGLCIGGLAFLNTWDGPVYLVALVGADGLRRLMMNRGRLTGRDWLGLLGFGVQLLALAFALYLPFWIAFRSQAGGLLPNVINPTSTPQFFLMFGPFLFILAPYLLVEAWRARGRFNAGNALLTTLLILLALAAVLFALVGIGSLIPSLRTSAMRFVEEAGGWDAMLPILLGRRVETLLTTLILLAGVFLVVGRLFARAGKRKTDDAEEAAFTAYPPATGFALLLVGMGLLLVLIPEFFYLRDNFGTRMNTIFKFYYQAWLVFSIAAAYGVWSLLTDAELPPVSPALRLPFAGVVAITLALGLLYPVMGVYTRMFVENGRMFQTAPPPLTLDGGSTFVAGDDYQAIMCLNALITSGDVVAVEAIGPAYRSEYGRVAALSGIPILLGWENHEGQWRGATYGAIAGTRPADIPRLYQDPRWETAQVIINTYGIDYIFYGQSERQAYGAAGEEKFRDHLEVVCERGNSRFYRASPVSVVAE